MSFTIFGRKLTTRGEREFQQAQENARRWMELYYDSPFHEEHGASITCVNPVTGQRYSQFKSDHEKAGCPLGIGRVPTPSALVKIDPAGVPL